MRGRSRHGGNRLFVPQTNLAVLKIARYGRSGTFRCFRCWIEVLLLTIDRGSIIDSELDYVHTLTCSSVRTLESVSVRSVETRTNHHRTPVVHYIWSIVLLFVQSVFPMYCTFSPVRCCKTFIIKKPKLKICQNRVGAWTSVLRTGYCMSQCPSPSCWRVLSLFSCRWQVAMSGLHVQGLDVAGRRRWRGVVKASITKLIDRVRELELKDELTHSDRLEAERFQQCNWPTLDGEFRNCTTSLWSIYWKRTTWRRSRQTWTTMMTGSLTCLIV